MFLFAVLIYFMVWLVPKPWRYHPVFGIILAILVILLVLDA